ncbi:hypothetical protein Rsub_00351 [Raphidocelis subcapitata]|uniref:Transcription factor CBF/NF-Y/archaeal histone domain-containing protein n=1 Tax=Raphidocelis subcapitata TaxID=307507 RepID=A0A2V0NQ50_9CHLO|nr:hypothetical protein Rsub_00351 [Raphidocelis subcapitata]|eukprot:GBF87640.1 hypothetical protein Rsub_00351 [Raphidocelis subcapitata]
MAAEPQLEVAVDDEHAEPEVASPSGGKDKESGLVLPLARVKKLIKSEPDVKVVSSEAIFLIGRAVELILDEMVARAHASMSRDARKALLYKDIANAVQGWEALDILGDAVPQKVLASTLMQQQKDKERQK